MKDLNLSQYDVHSIDIVPQDFVRRVYEQDNRLIAENKDGSLVELGTLVAPPARNIISAIINNDGELECTFDNGDMSNLGYVGNTINRTLPTFVKDGIFSAETNDFKSLRTYVTNGSVTVGEGKVTVGGSTDLVPNVEPNVFNPHEVTTLAITPEETGTFSLPTEVGDNTLIWDGTDDGIFILAAGTYKFDIKSFSTATGKTLIKLLDADTNDVLAVSNITISSNTPGNALPLFIASTVTLTEETMLKVVQTTEEASATGIGSWAIERWCVDSPIVTAHIVRTSAVNEIVEEVLDTIDTDVVSVLNAYHEAQRDLDLEVVDTFLSESNYFIVKDKFVIGNYLYITSSNKSVVISINTVTKRTEFLEGTVAIHDNGITVLAGDTATVITDEDRVTYTLPSVVGNIVASNASGTELMYYVESLTLPTNIPEGTNNEYFNLTSNKSPYNSSYLLANVLLDNVNMFFHNATPSVTSPIYFDFEFKAPLNLSSVTAEWHDATSVVFIVQAFVEGEWVDVGGYDGPVSGRNTTNFTVTTTDKVRINVIGSSRTLAVKYLMVQPEYVPSHPVHYNLTDDTVTTGLEDNVLKHVTPMTVTDIKNDGANWIFVDPDITAVVAPDSTVPTYLNIPGTEVSYIDGKALYLDGNVEELNYVHDNEWPAGTYLKDGWLVTGTRNAHNVMSSTAWQAGGGDRVSWKLETGKFKATALHIETPVQYVREFVVHAVVNEGDEPILVFENKVNFKSGLIVLDLDEPIVELILTNTGDYYSSSQWPVFTTLKLVESLEGQSSTVESKIDTTFSTENTFPDNVNLETFTTGSIPGIALEGIEDEHGHHRVDLVCDFNQYITLTRIAIAPITGLIVRSDSPEQIQVYVDVNGEWLLHEVIYSASMSSGVVQTLTLDVPLLTSKVKLAFINVTSDVIRMTSIDTWGHLPSTVTNTTLNVIDLDTDSAYRGPQVDATFSRSNMPSLVIPYIDANVNPNVYTLTCNVNQYSSFYLYEMFKTQGGANSFLSSTSSRETPVVIDLELLDKVRTVDGIYFKSDSNVAGYIWDVTVEVPSDTPVIRTVVEEKSLTVDDFDILIGDAVNPEKLQNLLLGTASYEPTYYTTSENPISWLIDFKDTDGNVLSLKHLRDEYRPDGEYLTIRALTGEGNTTVMTGNTLPVNAVRYNHTSDVEVTVNYPQYNTSNRSIYGMFSPNTSWYYRTANKVTEDVPCVIEIDLKATHTISGISYQYGSDINGFLLESLMVEIYTDEGTWVKVSETNDETVNWTIPKSVDFDVTVVTMVRFTFTAKAGNTQPVTMYNLQTKGHEVLTGTWETLVEYEDVRVTNLEEVQYRLPDEFHGLLELVTYNDEDIYTKFEHLKLLKASEVESDWLTIYEKTQMLTAETYLDFDVMDLTKVKMTFSCHSNRRFNIFDFQLLNRKWVSEITVPEVARVLSMTDVTQMSLSGYPTSVLTDRLYKYGTGYVTDGGTVIKPDGTLLPSTLGTTYVRDNSVLDTSDEPTGIVKQITPTGTITLPPVPERLLELNGSSAEAYRGVTRSSGGLHWLFNARRVNVDVYDEMNDTLVRLPISTEIKDIVRGDGQDIMCLTTDTEVLISDGIVKSPVLSTKFVIEGTDLYEIPYGIEALHHSGNLLASSYGWNNSLSLNSGGSTYSYQPDPTCMFETDVTVTVTHWAMTGNTVAYVPADISMEVSTDGLSWTTYALSMTAIDGVTKVGTFSEPVTGKFFRVTTTKQFYGTYARLLTTNPVSEGTPTYILEPLSYLGEDYMEGDHYVGKPKTVTYENVAEQFQYDTLNEDVKNPSSIGGNRGVPFIVYYDYGTPTTISEVRLRHGGHSSYVTDKKQIFGKVGEVWVEIAQTYTQTFPWSHYLLSDIIRLDTSIAYTEFKLEFTNSMNSTQLSSIVTVTDDDVYDDTGLAGGSKPTSPHSYMVSDHSGYTYLLGGNNDSMSVIDNVTKEVRYVSIHRLSVGTVNSAYWDYLSNRLVLRTTFGIYQCKDFKVSKVSGIPSYYPFTTVDDYEVTYLKSGELLLAPMANQSGTRYMYLEDMVTNYVEQILPAGLSPTEIHSQGSYGPDGRLYMTSQATTNSIINVDPLTNTFSYIDDIFDNGDMYLKPTLTKSGDLLFFPHRYVGTPDEFKAYRFKFQGATEVPDEVLNSVFYR